MAFRAETVTHSKAKRQELKNRESYLEEKLDVFEMKYVVDMTISTNRC